MSRFKKSSHVIWHCQYHLIWTPKCRFRILKDKVGREVYIQLRILCEQLKLEIRELNVQHLSKDPPEIIGIRSDGAPKRTNSDEIV